MLSTACPKPTSHAAEKKQTQAEKLAQRRIVYRLVSKRDKHMCRCCKATGPNLHHHHLKFRSRGGNDTEANLYLLCPVCHADLHAYRLAVVGDDARYTLRFVRAK